jgi:hypothetical protein
MFIDEKTGQMSFVEPRPQFDKSTRLWKEFLDYHSAHPEVYEHYKLEILNAIASGRDLYSSKIINEHNRWDRNYKISNNHTAYYARIFVEENPQYKGFFRFRPIKQV